MSKNTKQKIIDVTIDLFNTIGYSQVTLQKISKDAKISLGNLTYYFSKKDDLINVVYRQLVGELRETMTSFRAYPDFFSIDQQIRTFHEFLKKYRFFYVDMLDIERTHPKIEAEHREHVHFQINDIHNMLIFNVGKGLLRSNVELGIYHYVAQSIWMMTSQWSRMIEIRGLHAQDTADEFANATWSIMKGFFTEEGKQAYKDMCAKRKALQN